MMTDRHLARLLLDARRGTPVPTGPAPEDTAQAYRVQALVMAGLGEIGGWKVGAASPDGPISCAPMPASGVVTAPCRLDAAVFTRREVESEICFRLCADLPARLAPHGVRDVLAAIGTCHPGIEILQSRYAEPERAGSLALLADFIQHGAYVWGEPVEGWRGIDFSQVQVRQTITGGPERRAVGNPAGDMVRLLLWLANEGSLWAGGLRVDQIVTCGSWTGKTACPAGGTVTASFAGAAPLAVRLG